MTARNHRLLPAAKARACLALVLLALLAGVQAMVISERLHEHVHADAQHADHQCAVTLFSSGTVDTAASAVTVPAPEAALVVFLSLPQPVLVAAEHRLPPGRAPPVLS